MPVELRPRKAKPTAPAEASKSQVGNTPKTKAQTTPKSSKRKATAGASPATKKQKLGKAPINRNVADTAAPKPDERAASVPKAGNSKTSAENKEKKTTGGGTTEKAKRPTPEFKEEKTSSKVKGTPMASPNESEVRAAEVKNNEIPKTITSKSTTKKPARKSAKKHKPKLVDGETEQVDDAKEEQSISSDGEVDEKTEALVQTADSGSGDDPVSGTKAFRQGQDVGRIPVVSRELSKSGKEAPKAASLKGKDDTGVIYIGRLPHGFYEHEMKSYFGQFGPIRNLRVSRNKRTGKAKHFAFIEFEEASTAETAAKTMNNYLLFGHILKCSVIPKAQVHKDLFKGANKRFKAIPWNKMEGKKMERPKTEDHWERTIKRESKKRAARAKKLEALGYEFDAPPVKSVAAAMSIITPTGGARTATEAPPVVEDAPAGSLPAKAVEQENSEEAKEATEVQTTPAVKTRGRAAKTPRKKVSAATSTPRRTMRNKV